MHVFPSSESGQPIQLRPPKREIALRESTACAFDLTDCFLRRDELFFDKFNSITGSISCTDELQRTLNNLDRINSRLGRLRESASSLLDASVTDHEDFTREITAKVDYFEDLNSEGFPVDDLSNLVGAEKERVERYEERLSSVRQNIISQVDLELESRRASSRMYQTISQVVDYILIYHTERIRLMLGLISVIVIMWLLVTANDDPPEFEIHSGSVRIRPPNDPSSLDDIQFPE